MSVLLSQPARPCALSLTYKSLHTCRLSQRNAYDCYLSSCSQKSTCQESEKGRKNILKALAGRHYLVVLGIEEFNGPLYSVSYAPLDSPCRTQGLYPADIDLHSLICLLLQRLSYCWEGRGWLFADRMTWSHVKLLLVIGSFLFRHRIEGCVASLKGWIKSERNQIWLLKMTAKNSKVVQLTEVSM